MEQDKQQQTWILPFFFIVGGLVSLFWLFEIKILLLLLVLLLLVVLLLLLLPPEYHPYHPHAKRKDHDENTENENKSNILKKQKLLYLDYLIEKNNNYHRKYKSKNTVKSYVIEYWQMDDLVSDEIANFIRLILRDFIDPWYQYVSTNDEFIICVEEFLANALSILIFRGKIGLNPVLFFGEKICYSLELTLTKLREISITVRKRPEFTDVNPSMTVEWERYQMAIAEEFRNLGNLHPAYQWDENDQSTENLTMEEFFAKERLEKCERQYSKYIGTKLIKHLMTTPEDYNCKAVRYLGVELLSNTILASILSLITPLNINIWIDMGIKFLPYFSQSVLTSEGTNSQVDENHSDHHVHVELSSHYVGAIGLETVSSSCSTSTQEAAAAIVFREGCQLAPEDSEAAQISTIDYSGDIGKFIVRKCEFESLAAGVLCLSYIRPNDHSDKDISLETKSQWIVFDQSDNIETALTQAKIIRKIFEDPKHLNVPLILSDSVVGHIFFFAQKCTSDPQVRYVYHLLACTHIADLEAFSVDPPKNGIRWTSFEEMVHDILPSLERFDDRVRGSSAEILDEILPEDSSKTNVIPLEESFLHEQRKLYCFFELTGAIDEFLDGDSLQSKDGSALLTSIKILSSDHTKIKSFRRVIGTLRNIIIDGLSPTWIDNARRGSEPQNGPFTCLLDNVSSTYARCMSMRSSLSSENILKPPDDFNLTVWAAFVMSRCQITPKDWKNLSERQPSLDSDDPCCLLCGDRKCYLLADSSVRNYPLNKEENIFIRDMKLDILTDQLDVNESSECQYDFLVYILYISGAYGLLYSFVNILAVLLNPYHAIQNHSSSFEMVSQRLNPPAHFVYSIQRCWSSGAILTSSTEAGRVLDLLAPLDRISIFISPQSDPAIQAPKTPQRIGIGKTVGLKIEKALAAATRVFGDSEDDQDVQPPPPSPQIAQSISSEREKSESVEENSELNPKLSFFTESGRTLSSKGQMIMASLTSLEDSLANTASNLTVAAPPPSYLTFTSQNTDIIEIFRMRKKTADDKWESKNSGSTKSTARIEIRRAEAKFKISVLLRDRPSPTFLEERRMILPRAGIAPPMYWAEINKSERLTQNFMLYTITVYKTQSGVCPRHHASHSKEKFDLFSVMKTSESSPEDPSGYNTSPSSSLLPPLPPPCICHCWEVQRRYSDFDDFHKHLKSQLSLEAFQKLRLPAKNFLKVVQSQHFIEKRMKGLQDYLRAVMCLIPGSFEIDTFLEEQVYANSSNVLSEEITPPSTLNSLPVINEDEERFSEANTAVAAPVEGGKELSTSRQSKIRKMVNSIYIMQKVTQTIQESVRESVSSTVPPGEVKSTVTLTPEEVMKIKNDKIEATKMLLIEERVFDLINELLEVDDMTAMKKNIVSLAMRSIRLLFRTSMADWMQHQSKVYSPDTQAGYFLKWIRELIWPNDVFYVAPASYVPPELSAIRKQNMEHIANIIPSSLNTYLGEHTDIKLLEKLYTLLDNPFILKSLVYMLVDSILIDLFPEFAEKLSGIDALNH